MRLPSFAIFLLALCSCLSRPLASNARDLPDIDPQEPRSGSWGKDHREILEEIFARLAEVARFTQAIEFVYHENQWGDEFGSPASCGCSRDYDCAVHVYYGVFEIAHSPDALAWILAHELSHFDQRAAFFDSLDKKSKEVYRQCETAYVRNCLKRSFFPVEIYCKSKFADLEEKDEWCLTENPSIIEKADDAFRKVQRQHELEADRLGLGLMAKAGFDPSLAKQAITGIADWAWARNFLKLPWLMIHEKETRSYPSNQERLQRIEEELGSLCFR